MAQEERFVGVDIVDDLMRKAFALALRRTRTCAVRLASKGFAMPAKPGIHVAGDLELRDWIVASTGKNS